ncbi:MOSC-domain-containing protein [Ramicandelaber brevisporus]|nr:MOSC-domain-containing protein [Ramicandelaber brevisporus]
MKFQFATLATAAVLAVSHSVVSAAQFTVYSKTVYFGEERNFQYDAKPGFCSCVNMNDFSKRVLSARWDNQNEGCIAFYSEPNCQGANPTWPLKKPQFAWNLANHPELPNGISSSKIAVSGLYIYPIKSCAGISLERGLVEKTGFQFDRNWIIVRGRDNKFVTQRSHPVLALIKPEIVFPPSAAASEITVVKGGNVVADDGSAFVGVFERGYLRLTVDHEQLGSTAEEIPELRVPLFHDFNGLTEEDPRVEKFKVWKSTVTGVEVSTDATEWVTKVINHPGAFNTSSAPAKFEEYKLFVKYPDVVRPLIKNKPPADLVDYESQTAYADGFPFLIISQASIDDLNAKLTEKQALAASQKAALDTETSAAIDAVAADDDDESPPAPDKQFYSDKDLRQVSHRNFRTNILVDGGSAFQEDDWRLITFGLGSQKFFVNCRCSRCELPNTDPDTGKREGHEPQRTLIGYRRVDSGAKFSACFGVNAMSLDVGGSISLEDEVQVIETGLPPIEKAQLVD